MSPPDMDPRTTPAEMTEALSGFAEMLREALKQPSEIPARVVRRAAADAVYLHTLIGNRGDPAALEALMAGTPVGLPKWAGPPSSVLFAQATRALLRWGRAGFGQVDAETFERRRSACLACPHLGSPGGQLAYKLLRAERDSLCGLCGCAVERKARLPTEECPVAHPTEPGLTRWSEPRS